MKIDVEMTVSCDNMKTNILFLFGLKSSILNWEFASYIAILFRFGCHIFISMLPLIIIIVTTFFSVRSSLQ